jgi:hypothetical protein
MKKHPLLLREHRNLQAWCEQLASINHMFLHSPAWDQEEYAGVEHGVFYYSSVIKKVKVFL